MFARILLTVDNTESGDTAVSFTCALARRLDSEVRVVHVNELLVGGRGFAAETELEAMNVVDTATARLRGAACGPTESITWPTASPSTPGSPIPRWSGVPT